MAYEHKPGQGSLFKNDHKSSDRHPHFTGMVLAHRDIKAGEKLSLAAWEKDAGRGVFYSLSMSDPRSPRDSQDATRQDSDSGLGPQHDDSNLNDEIPFS